MGEKQPDVYSAITHITDGIYHSIKIIRKYSQIELYVDGIRIIFEGKNRRSIEQKNFLAQRRLTIGSYSNISIWNGIIAGRFFLFISSACYQVFTDVMSCRKRNKKKLKRF